MYTSLFAAAYRHNPWRGDNEAPFTRYWGCKEPLIPSWPLPNRLSRYTWHWTQIHPRYLRFFISTSGTC